MKVEKTAIPGVVEIYPDVFNDERGYFFESFRDTTFSDKGLPSIFRQVNQASSQKDVIRGLHYQLEHPQGKLIRVISGRIRDVAVDIRKRSPTYGHYKISQLTDKNNKMLYIPEGFAHGYVVESDLAVVEYHCTDIYVPDDQFGINWNDPDLNISWGISTPILSEKDKELPFLKEQKYLPAYK